MQCDLHSERFHCMLQKLKKCSALELNKMTFQTVLDWTKSDCHTRLVTSRDDCCSEVQSFPWLQINKCGNECQTTKINQSANVWCPTDVFRNSNHLNISCCPNNQISGTDTSDVKVTLNLMPIGVILSHMQSSLKPEEKAYFILQQQQVYNTRLHKLVKNFW